MKRNIFLLFMMLVALGVQAQTAASVLTVPEGRLNPGAAGGLKYDRIETVRTIPTGKLYAFAVPATVDGYFFGADSERYELVNIQNVGETSKQFNVKKMADDADFVSGKLYIVCPEVGCDRLYSYTAGLQTPVGTSQVNLECYPVDLTDVTRDRQVNVADVTAMVDIILGNDADEKYDHQVADVNGDGNIDVSDVTLMVNAILNNEYNSIVIVEE